MSSSPPPVPYIPETAPFTAEQRAWLNGFLAGIYSSQGGQPAASAAQPAATVNIYFGSESGNSEALAKKLAKEVGKKGFLSKAVGLDKIKSTDLVHERYAVIVTSTFGDGEPPENAKAFHASLHDPAHPKLENLKFAILSLGDKNYEKFCQCGIEFDERFEALGAKRLVPRVDCDVDYEEAANQWKESLFALLASDAPTESFSRSVEVVASPNAAPKALIEPYSKKNPFPAKLIHNRLLSAPGSAKETRHYEISLAGSGLSYEVGDALGVIPQNCPELVQELLTALGFEGDEAVEVADQGSRSIREAFTQNYDITKISSSLLKAFAEKSGDETLKNLVLPTSGEALSKFVWGREVIDLVLAYPAVKFTPAEFVPLLRKLLPRLYSISSSLNAHPEQVHLTVSTVRYESLNRRRKGVCSTFLAERATGGVPVFVQVSHGFRLPTNDGTPVIMVGPGTGIAPFRAFLQDRSARNAKGPNWLFFGEQHAATDFYYKEELEQLSTAGVLTRLSTAFSRDQAEKIYVQTRMEEEGAELWKWLQAGAHFYVCGDAKRMAKDVDLALHRLVAKHGGMDEAAAAAYVKELKSAKRYQRDVY